MFGANPIRAAIVRLLAQSSAPMPADEIFKSLNVAPLPRHLDELEGAGFVVVDRSHAPAGYRLDREAVRRELDVYSRYLLGDNRASDENA